MMSELALFQVVFDGVLAASLRWTPIFLAAFLASRFLPASVDRKRLWTFVLLALPALPLLTLLAPEWAAPEWQAAAGHEISQDVMGAVAAVSGQAEAVPGAPKTAAPGVQGAVAGLWLLGLLALLMRELLGRLVAFALGRSALGAPERVRQDALMAAESLGLKRPDVRLGDVKVPLLCGVLRPRVVLPVAAVSWPASRLQASLLHELAHQRHRDPWLDLFARMLSAVFFFHPGVWLARRALGQEMEQVADAAVVDVGRDHGLDEASYARVLLEMAEQARRGFTPGLAMARPSGLESRLRVLIAGPRRTSRFRQVLVATLLCLLALSSAGLTAGPREWLLENDGTWHLQCDGDAACVAIQKEADRILAASGFQGALIVQKVETGELVAYSARGPAPVPSVPPASVAKLAIATLWWDAGLGAQSVSCPKEWSTADGVKVRSQRDRGEIEAPHEMLIHSCSTAAGVMMQQLIENGSARGIEGQFAKFGFAPSAQNSWLPAFLPVPRIDPGPEWEQRRPEMAAALGRISTTPFHVASFLQAIGHDGVRLPMRRPGQSAGSEERLMSSETAENLRRSMAAVMSEGTGQRAGKELEGEAWQLLGKTGTRARNDGVYDGWFAGLAMDAHARPRFAVVAFLDGGGMGSGESAMLAARMTRSLATVLP